MSPETPAEIECPVCGGQDCEHCNNGFFEITECPSRFIGGELLADIQVVSASEHHLPVAGGLLDQAAWWFDLKQQLTAEENLIQAEQYERKWS